MDYGLSNIAYFGTRRSAAQGNLTQNWYIDLEGDLYEVTDGLDNPLIASNVKLVSSPHMYLTNDDSVYAIRDSELLLENVESISTGVTAAAALLKTGSIVGIGDSVYGLPDATFAVYNDFVKVEASDCRGSIFGIRQNNDVVGFSPFDTGVPPKAHFIRAVSPGCLFATALTTNGAVIQWGSTTRNAVIRGDIPSPFNLLYPQLGEIEAMQF